MRFLPVNRKVGRDSVEPISPPQAVRTQRGSSSPDSERMLTPFASLRSKVDSTESRPTLPQWLLSLVGIATLAAFLLSAQAAELSPKEMEAARKLNTTKCAKCHKLYHPAHYQAAQWRDWMEKMSKKSKLKPTQQELLTRYFETLKAAGE
jgi:hypothetical protein